MHDPSDCKTCPEWDDRAGRCRIPPRERTCGSEGWRHEGPSGPANFDLFEDEPCASLEAE